jgi:hypothetical protein
VQRAKPPCTVERRLVWPRSNLRSKTGIRGRLCPFPLAINLHRGRFLHDQDSPRPASFPRGTSNVNSKPCKVLERHCGGGRNGGLGAVHTWSSGPTRVTAQRQEISTAGCIPQPRGRVIDGRRPATKLNPPWLAPEPAAAACMACILLVPACGVWRRT